MSIKQGIVAQFKQPHGCIGHLAGIIMANRSSNIERNEWTLDLLNLEPTDRVLEVGFGPGIAIKKATRIVQQGLIVGVDHSETMLHQANKRNTTAIKEGRAKLYLGEIESLPDFEQTFNKIYSANVVQFWDNPEKEFAHLYDLLSRGGKIATTYMPRHSGATNEDSKKKANEIIESLNTVGFNNIQVEEIQLSPLSAICVLAEK
ncbi:MAG: class I SAM-dependent methyltransferase [Gammaproteobacteria bacterium]